MTDPNSMLYWYPRIQWMDEIPQPKTIMVEVDEKLRDWLDIVVGRNRLSNLKEIYDAADKIGYPLFMRTDKLSGKHQWEKTCFVEFGSELENNIAGLVEASLECDMIGKPVKALVFREYIEMDSTFSAFGGLPISRERRYFVENGEVLCHHPYWIEEAIWFGVNMCTPMHWKNSLQDLNSETKDEIALLSSHAVKVSQALDGYWSVDFCKSKAGIWYLIDCAQGRASWHPNCPLKRQLDYLDSFFE